MSTFIRGKVYEMNATPAAGKSILTKPTRYVIMPSKRIYRSMSLLTRSKSVAGSLYNKIVKVDYPIQERGGK